MGDNKYQLNKIALLTGQQEQSIDLTGIDMTDIEKIEHKGTTGGKDGSYLYCLTESESNDLIDFLHQVELGNKVDERKASSSGAVSYYTLHFTDGETLTISPGRYFKMEDTYYEFNNYDELWDEFIGRNSIH